MGGMQGIRRMYQGVEAKSCCYNKPLQFFNGLQTKKGQYLLKPQVHQNELHLDSILFLFLDPRWKSSPDLVHCRSHRRRKKVWLLKLLLRIGTNTFTHISLARHLAHLMSTGQRCILLPQGRTTNNMQIL